MNHRGWLLVVAVPLFGYALVTDPVTLALLGLGCWAVAGVLIWIINAEKKGRE